MLVSCGHWACQIRLVGPGPHHRWVGRLSADGVLYCIAYTVFIYDIYLFIFFG